MTDLVSSADIERKVGASRHPQAHIGRAVSAEQRVYILHSQQCLDSGIDLRDCMFSRVLDRGISLHEWAGHEDRPVRLRVLDGLLAPLDDSGESCTCSTRTVYEDGTLIHYADCALDDSEEPS